MYKIQNRFKHERNTYMYILVIMKGGMNIKFWNLDE
jgi:hypothetical protein